MGTINIKSEIKEVKEKGKIKSVRLYRRAELRKFSPVALGLGDIRAAGKQIDVIAAVFDLSGFTSFCSQSDADLDMGTFLNEFLDWLFANIRSQLEVKRFKPGISLSTLLPFFAKFTGDGVLFLWNTENMNMVMICNVLITLRNICNRYSNNLVPEMKKNISHIPKSLRGGVARGKVCSVGDGRDYVGACINIASRLQKSGNIGFCFLKKGIDFKRGMVRETADKYVVKRMAIRGIGRDELVVVRKPDFEKLSKRNQGVFKDA